ncbi:hypothetical protein K493DRAFT_311056 [Basidiobolus meristosporus CBS 931.73]|uniref:CYTH domain-containing protein n=1 Tax=Basidiobolus meristosporus CBS 931.73 TaxID=1314790 RepID=A0A1Y1Z4U8_9FUNG|nr:hypothetical protein K493DRAFT_311056 [Basidiobolus meristosporus CBS 931.73]|eukprot:ORY05226.1 hypothetical protein K493DRAFT_311056 [Basidiobolus meristosporus CBS 931.73]
MEIEIKIRFQSAKELQRFESCLGKPPKAIEQQENYYFDGSEHELEQQRTVFRLRKISKSSPEEPTKQTKAKITLKGNAVLEAGISRVQETEEPFDYELVDGIVKDPDSLRLHSTKSPLLESIVKNYPVDSYKLVGYYNTLRKLYEWENYILAVDDTEFPFGRGYEVELESEDAEVAKAKLVSFLQDNDIQYSFSKRNKFVNMRMGEIL